MPELPEIEVIKLGLQKKIIGLKVQKIQVINPKSFIGNPDLVEGKKVLNIWRRAKILGIDLSDDKGVTLLFHLKMSGQLVWKGKSGKGKGEKFIGGHPTEDMLGKMPNSHTRVVFTLQSQESSVKSQESSKENPRLSTLATSHLYFNDQRKFGWVKIVQSSKFKVQSEKILGKLGPEPLDKSFTRQILKSNLLNHKSQPVKVAIMDQSIVAGVGNIYSSEACFLAKIDPRTKVNSLTDKQFQALHQGVIESLQAGIKYGGSTRVHFVNPEGRKGYFLDYAFVYGRDKLPCKICKTSIKKISLGGRGTYFCPCCQR